MLALGGESSVFTIGLVVVVVVVFVVTSLVWNELRRLVLLVLFDNGLVGFLVVEGLLRTIFEGLPSLKSATFL